MLGLGKKSPDGVCALIIDIGSGSAGMAIIYSDPENENPEIIWSNREFSLMKDSASEEALLKNINTTLINSFLELGSTGLKALNEWHKGAKIETVQITMSAPWSHTVTKSVNYSDDKSFKVNNDLIKQLEKSATKTSLESFQNSDLDKSSYELITNQTVGIKVNGYSVEHINQVKGERVELSHIVALAHKAVIKTVTESCEKIIPKANLEFNSFICTFYQTLKQMKPDTAEICLVDITNEATELGIVRDGTLTYCTNIPYGGFSLAREISKLSKISNEEAYTYLKGNEAMILGKLNPEKQDQLLATISAYELKIAALLQETGDKLSIPKTIFIHTDKHTEEFFLRHITEGSQAATGSEHTVHPVTAKLFPEQEINDTAILLSVNYFHLKNCLTDNN